MPDRVMRWWLHLNATTPEKAADVAARVAARMDDRLQVVKIARYWKIEGQQIATCGVTLLADSLPEAVVEALTLANAVGGGWHVNAPEEHPDGWYFDGWASGNFRIAGVEFARWTLAPLLPDVPSSD